MSVNDIDVETRQASTCFDGIALAQPTVCRFSHWHSVSMLAILRRGPTIPTKARRMGGAPGPMRLFFNSLLVRHPCCAGLVVFEAGSALEIILGLIERE